MVAGTSVDRPLVGRADERDRLMHLVDDAADGRAGSLLLTGEAGVGKTALVRDLCRRAGGRVDVLWAACLPLSSLSVPFLPLTSALREWAGARGVPVPVLGRPGGDGSAGGPLEFDAFLDEACRAGPILLVVDDLQWADQSSLDVLMYLTAGPADRRLAVIATVRAGATGPGHPLRRWLADIRRLPRVDELVLGPLDRPGTEEQLAGLLGRPPHEALVDDVFARTRGNAYQVALLTRGLSPDATAAPTGLPHELRDAVSRAWVGLSPAARELTRLVAVAGRPQRVAQLAAVASPAISGALVPLLREAVDGGVLDVLDGGRYWFVHPLLAEVLEDGLLPEERQAGHAAFAAALQEVLRCTGDTDVELVVDVADHHHRAGDVEQAYRWALRGATAAELAGGATECVRLLRRALDLRPRVSGPGPSRTELLMRVKSAAERAGRHEEELAALDDLLSVVDPHQQPLLTAELLVRRMHLRFLAGREFFEVAHMQEAVRLAATDRTSPQYALAMAELADAELWNGVPTGPGRAREAVRLARACGSDRPLIYALVADVIAQNMAEEARNLDGLPAGRAQAEEARAAAVRSRDFFGYVHATLWVGNCMDYFSAENVLDLNRRAREELVRLGAPHAYVAWMSGTEAAGLLLRGDGRACQERLRVSLGATPGPLADTDVRLTAALLACRQGRPAEAGAHLARAEELFVEQSGFLVFSFDAVRAELAVATGDARAAVSAARSGLGQASWPTMVERLLPLAARALADEAQRRRDRGADPGAPVDELDELRRQYPRVIADFGPGATARRMVRAMQLTYDAECLRGKRDPDVGQAWVRAAAGCREAHLPWDEAYAQWRAADALLPARATRSQGAAALRRAHELAVEMGARPVLADVEALARSARVPLAVEPERSVAHGEPGPAPAVAGLTRREREILARIVAGRTYGEIARELVISEKTVGSHISNMLRKTGTANRVQLAQLARRRATPPGSRR